MDVRKLLILVLLGIAAAAVGLFLPEIYKKFITPTETTDSADQPTGGAGMEGVGGAYIPFGSVVVNLNQEALNYYFSIDIMVGFDVDADEQSDEFKDEMEDLSKLIERKRPILKSWLIEHLSEQTLTDIRGGEGVRNLKRDIQDNFNEILFPDGSDRVEAILFNEYFVEAPRE